MYMFKYKCLSDSVIKPKITTTNNKNNSCWFVLTQVSCKDVVTVLRKVLENKMFK